MPREEEYFDKKLVNIFDELEGTEESPLMGMLHDIKERYTDFQYIDEGGLKVIQTCKDLRTGRTVAMASLKNRASEKQKEAFLREARITASLQHPNIIPLHDLGLKYENPWFTMKFVSGTSLENIFSDLKAQKTQQCVDLSDRLDIFIKVCDAVAYAHSRGVLHLDIKPDNIQISDYGDVLLCDWGIARVMAAECDEDLLDCYTFNPKDIDFTIDGLVKGTPGYMAPEQTTLCKSKKSIQTDIFSLGCVLYKILTLEKPFKGATIENIIKNTVAGHFPKPTELDPSIPPSLEAVCLKAMAIDPKDRYASVLNLQKEILNYRKGFATNAENASMLKVLKLWYKRNKTLGIAILAVFCISLFTLWFAFTNLKLEKINALQHAQQLKLEADKLKIETEYHKKFNKDAAPRFFERAKIAFNAYDNDEALNFANSAIELNPELNEAWELKGLIHIIKEEFSQALHSLRKSPKKKLILKIAQDFYAIKANDTIHLPIPQYLALYQRSLDDNIARLTSGLMHQKALSDISIHERIIICKEVIRLQNHTNLERNFKGHKINFIYDNETKHLDLSNNPWMQTALILQNFPAVSANFSHTGINNFICFRKQALRSLNVSHTKIIELQRLDNPELLYLDISHTAISNLTRLKELSLLELNISHSAVRDPHIIRDLHSLRKLTIHQGQFTKAQLKTFPPHLEVIIVDWYKSPYHENKTWATQ